jgi:hypothetical protein
LVGQQHDWRPPRDSRSLRPELPPPL